MRKRLIQVLISVLAIAFMSLVAIWFNLGPVAHTPRRVCERQ